MIYYVSDRGACTFFFNDTATTEIYTLSLHDALPIFRRRLADLRRPRGREAGRPQGLRRATHGRLRHRRWSGPRRRLHRSEEHTSELQSRQYLVCRLLLEKKKYYHFPALHLTTLYS